MIQQLDESDVAAVLSDVARAATPLAQALRERTPELALYDRADEVAVPAPAVVDVVDTPRIDSPAHDGDVLPAVAVVDTPGVDARQDRGDAWAVCSSLVEELLQLSAAAAARRQREEAQAVCSGVVTDLLQSVAVAAAAAAMEEEVVVVDELDTRQEGEEALREAFSVCAGVVEDLLQRVAATNLAGARQDCPVNVQAAAAAMEEEEVAVVDELDTRQEGEEALQVGEAFSVSTGVVEDLLQRVAATNLAGALQDCSVNVQGHVTISPRPSTVGSTRGDLAATSSSAAPSATAGTASSSRVSSATHRRSFLTTPSMPSTPPTPSASASPSRLPPRGAGGRAAAADSRKNKIGTSAGAAPSSGPEREEARRRAEDAEGRARERIDKADVRGARAEVDLAVAQWLLAGMDSRCCTCVRETPYTCISILTHIHMRV